MVAVNVNTFMKDCLNRSLDRFEVLIVVYFLDPKLCLKKSFYTLKQTIYETYGRKNAMERRTNSLSSISSKFLFEISIKSFDLRVVEFRERGKERVDFLIIFSKSLCFSIPKIPHN